MAHRDEIAAAIPADAVVSPLTLEPAQRSDIALKQILQQQCQIMRHNRQAIIDDTDSECLHDFRIAVRRARTAIKQLPDVLPKRLREHHLRQLARLGNLTSPLRDLDVMLSQFDGYRSLLPTDQQADLAPALPFIQQQRQKQWLATRRYLASATCLNFIADWSHYLTEPVTAHTRHRNARRPIKPLADKRIWRLYKKIIKQGSRIEAQSPPEELHELRKACKNLRYLIEFTRSLYRAEKIKNIINTLKRLQDILGTYQDLWVHIAFFARLRQQMNDRHRLASDTDRALAEVMRQLEQQQHHCRAHFHSRFVGFASEKHRNHAEELFKP